MKNKKVLALLVSLVLIVAVALPGTLAVSSDQDAVNSDFTVDTATPAPETPEQPVDPENPEQPEQPETPEQPEQPVVPETQEITGEPQTPAEVPACTCDPAPLEGEAHKEGCPLYVAPLTCTCDPQPNQGEPHAETCPLYVAPELTLVERLLATETADDFMAIIAGLSEEELVFSCEDFDRIDAHYIFLTTGEYPNYEPVVDTVIETVSYTYVAPFANAQG